MLKQLSNLIYCDMRDLECEMPPSCRFFGNAFADFPFLLIDDFLSRDECAAIVESALANGETAEAKVVDGANASKVDTAHRSTVWHTINEAALAIYDRALHRAKPAIERFFGRALLEATKPQVLGYRVGDFYDSHADNCAKVVGADGRVAEWKLVKPARVITTVLFLNDNFKGGKLNFDYLFETNGSLATLAPVAGLLVAFPSNPIFAHSVDRVTEGYRLSIAQWHNAMS